MCKADGLKQKKKLYLVTTNYPNSGSDGVFAFPEVSELAKRFDVTVICTTGRKDCANIQEGVEYFFYNQNLTAIKKIKYILKYLFVKQCREDLWDIIKRCHVEGRDHLLGRIRKSIEFYACGEEFYVFFSKNVNNGSIEDEAIFYTFWCNECSLPMIIHRKKYPQYHLVTRLHGYDLYEERYLYCRQPFKKVINRNLEKLFFIADRPRLYYLDKYPELRKDKAETMRLGVFGIEQDYGQKKLSSFSIVSCSNVIPLKRVHLIIEALATLEEEISWVHFGSGESMKEIEILAEDKLKNKENITYSFEGKVPNTAVRKFYAENKIDCFITTSSTEGCPVSIMEAMAAGIPVIGTAVGDIPFMINGNGILLDETPTVEEIADAIKMVFYASDKKRNEMKSKSFGIWKEYYDAEKNAPLFGQKLQDMIC